MIEVVDRLEQRLKEIEERMADPAVLSDQKAMIELNRERRQVGEILVVGRRYRRLRREIEDARQIIATSDDDELVEMAREELHAHEEQFDEVEREFKLKLLPRDPDDNKAAIVEIRAGTGGDEAGLFVGDVFRMYQ
ncbi:MAG: PCRF domain-containing protein, partial [Candidatus Zixiibacteriota bacterium]